DLPQEVIPLRNYPTDEQILLKAWESALNTKPKSFVDKIKAQELKDNAAEQALAAKNARVEKLKQLVPPVKPSPLRQWVLGILIVFIMLFIALVGALLWVFHKGKFVSAYRTLLNLMQAIKNQAKAFKARIPTKANVIPQDAATDLQESAPATPVSTALPPTPADDISESMPAQIVMPESAEQAAPVSADVTKEEISKDQAPLSETPDQGQQPNAQFKRCGGESLSSLKEGGVALLASFEE
ncbi:MAG TPA: hypothetical protein PLD88_03300, partial [Candidatus Berkiella sp.]|nr:hypothetical protein [Candidatus Berkiella sp.]